MRKFLRCAAFVCLAAILFAGFGCGKSDGKVKIRLNEVTRSVFYAPQYVAISEGFFEKEGLTVELSTSQGADQVMAAVLSGSVEIGFAGPESAIYVYNEGKEDYCKVFAQLTKRDGSFLIAREGGDDFKWEDLRGKTVLPGRKGGVPYMTLEYLLKSKGLVPGKDLEFDNSIQFSLLAGAFTAGTGDYVALFEPTATGLENEGVGKIVASIGEEAGEIPYTAYFALKSRIEKEPDTFERFTRAIYEGERWVKEHTSEEIARSIAGFFPDTDEALLSTVVGRYKSIDAWCEDPVLRKEAFDKLQEVISEAGELSEKAPYDKVVDNTFAMKVTEEKK